MAGMVRLAGGCLVQRKVSWTPDWVSFPRYKPSQDTSALLHRGELSRVKLNNNVCEFLLNSVPFLYAKHREDKIKSALSPQSPHHIARRFCLWAVFPGALVCQDPCVHVLNQVGLLSGVVTWWPLTRLFIELY